MADRKANFLITMVFDENLDIGKQIDTELAFRNQIIKDLQHLITGKEIEHFIIADDEVINKKLTEERKVGKWICVHHIENKITYDSWKCSECQHDFNSEEESMVDFDEYKFCPNCGAEMRGCENG